MSAQNATRWIRITLLCDVTPCSLVKWVDFTGYRVTSNFWEEEITQRIEAAGSRETRFHMYKTTMRHIQECTHRHRDRRQNHKSRQHSPLGDVKEYVEDVCSVFFGGTFAQFLARSIAFTTRAVYLGFQVNHLSPWQFLDKFLGFSLSFLIPLILHVHSSTIWRTDNRPV